ncbi:MAG: nicotinate-nucleotide adenylyltransferase [Elusimicrobiota bacterium]|jgi:nicotinate-nucleotide adenylyltransferase
MKIALFGGTFNPIHLGHLILAESARVQFQLGRVLFIPAGHPPHKQEILISAHHRLAMIRLAVRGNPFFQVSDWEARQERSVYTCETLDYFLQDRRHEWFFLMGSDSLSRIHTWRSGAALLDRCSFLIAERPEKPWGSLPALLRRKTRLIHSPPVAMASQEIRYRVGAGGSIRYHVPEAVARYIQRHRLYRGKGSV